MELMTLNAAKPLTMNSREIAELCDKRHDNVKRTIETLANQGVIESPQIEEISTATKPVSVYVFSGERGKRDSIIIVAQLCPEFTARLVDRWQELEEKVKQPDPMQVLNDPAMMRGLLLTYSEKVLSLEAANAELAPKAAVVDRIVTVAEGTMNVTMAAKNLQVQPKVLFTWMSAHRWIYRRSGGSSWVAYQDKIQQGLLQHKITTVERTDGSEKVVEQVLVTPKGLAKLAGELGPICA